MSGVLVIFNVLYVCTVLYVMYCRHCTVIGSYCSNMFSNMFLNQISQYLS